MEEEPRSFSCQSRHSRIIIIASCISLISVEHRLKATVTVYHSFFSIIPVFFPFLPFLVSAFHPRELGLSIEKGGKMGAWS